MLRLAAVTCLVLGIALAKPPPPDKPGDSPDIKPDGGNPVSAIEFVPASLQEDPEPKPADDNPVSTNEFAPASLQGDPDIKPADDNPASATQLVPASLQDDPDPIPFEEGEHVRRQRTYTLPSGRYRFTSPNYPRKYPNNYYRSFTVRGNRGQAITISCNPFRMERHSCCRYDYLSINGRKYCGTNRPPTTTVSELRIVIKTDYSVTDTGFYCLLTIAPSTGCRCGRRQTRIVGGTNARAGEFPWQVGLVPRGGTRTFCGGSVINNRYVLTAAHCTAGSSPSRIQVMLGDLRIGVSDAGERRYSVQRIIQHPQYVSPPWSRGWDFALLRLSSEITFSNTISPVCLPTAGQTYAGATAIASGYGRVGATRPQATTLQHVRLPVWSQSSCTRRWSFLTSSMICAGGYASGGRSVCMGDSGGPLVTQVSGSFRLIGVVSFGRPCAVAGWPDVYGRVTAALSWISSNTADAATCRP